MHRDVKPANILLVDYSNEDRRPRAKLTDFGVAVITATARRRTTAAPPAPRPTSAPNRPPANRRARQRRVFAGAGPARRADRENGLPRRADPVRRRAAAPRPADPRGARAHVGRAAVLHAGPGPGRSARRPGKCPWPCARKSSTAPAATAGTPAAAADRRGRAGCARSSGTGSSTPPRTAPSTGSRRSPHGCSRCPWRSSVLWTMTGSGSRPTTAPMSRRSAGTRGCAPPPILQDDAWIIEDAVNGSPDPGQPAGGRRVRPAVLCRRAAAHSGRLQPGHLLHPGPGAAGVQRRGHPGAGGPGRDRDERPGVAAAEPARRSPG